MFAPIVSRAIPDYNRPIFDRQHDALKRQLYHYSQFVNVSAEMYRAIHMESTGTSTSKESTSSKKNIEKK